MRCVSLTRGARRRRLPVRPSVHRPPIGNRGRCFTCSLFIQNGTKNDKRSDRTPFISKRSAHIRPLSDALSCLVAVGSLARSVWLMWKPRAMRGFFAHISLLPARTSRACIAYSLTLALSLQPRLFITPAAALRAFARRAARVCLESRRWEKRRAGSVKLAHRTQGCNHRYSHTPKGLGKFCLLFAYFLLPYSLY